MPISWTDPIWILESHDPQFASCPPLLGNGLIGARLGAFILGTDRTAPSWQGTKGPDTRYAIPRFDPASPLPCFARFARDGGLLALPSWHMLDLRVDGVRFQPGQGMFRGRSWLDMRTGEAGLDGTWNTRIWSEGPGRSVRISIRMLIPRTIRHGGFFELDVESDAEEMIAQVGWESAHLTDLPVTWREDQGDMLGEGRTAGRGRALAFGSRLLVQQGQTAGVACGAGHGRWSVHGKGGRLRLALHAAIRGGMEMDEVPLKGVMADLKALSQGRDGSLRTVNEAAWKGIWASGLDVSIVPVGDRQLVLAQQFHLLTSYGPEPWPNAPLGLSSAGWGGQQMWDTDLWTFRAILPLWPELATAVIRARIHQLPLAREAARSAGLSGAWIAHMSDEDGVDLTHALYREELAPGAWAALAAADVWRVTRDRGVLTLGWPLLRDVAEFFASRCVRSQDGIWHLRGVVPADEYVCEHGRGTCDDSVSTNLVVRAVLLAGIEAAQELKEPVPALWRQVAEGLFIQVPDQDGIIPEYTGYAGQEVKQADVALAFYPLGLDPGPDRIRRNLDYYRARCDVFGPLMSVQIEACIRMRLGDVDEGIRLLFGRYRRHVRGPFLVPTECVHNDNAVFMTGCGGLIQALIYGLTPYRQPGMDPSLVPRLGADW